VAEHAELWAIGMMGGCVVLLSLLGGVQRVRVTCAGSVCGVLCVA